MHIAGATACSTPHACTLKSTCNAVDATVWLEGGLRRGEHRTRVLPFLNGRAPDRVASGTPCLCPGGSESGAEQGSPDGPGLPPVLFAVPGPLRWGALQRGLPIQVHGSQQPVDVQRARLRPASRYPPHRPPGADGPRYVVGALPSCVDNLLVTSQANRIHPAYIAPTSAPSLLRSPLQPLMWLPAAALNVALLRSPPQPLIPARQCRHRVRGPRGAVPALPHGFPVGGGAPPGQVGARLAVARPRAVGPVRRAQRARWTTESRHLLQGVQRNSGHSNFGQDLKRRGRSGFRAGRHAILTGLLLPQTYRAVQPSAAATSPSGVRVILCFLRRSDEVQCCCMPQIPTAHG